MGERFDAGARKVLPYSLMALLLILNSVSVPLAVAVDLKPPFFLMGLYYWAIYRPTLIPPWMAFSTGILADLVGGLPLGLNAVVFVLVDWLVTDQRRFLMGQSFIMVWVGYFFVSVFALHLQWLIFGLVNLSWLPVRPLWFSLLLGMALFPLVCVTLHWTHKILPSPVGSLEPRR